MLDSGCGGRGCRDVCDAETNKPVLLLGEKFSLFNSPALKVLSNTACSPWTGEREDTPLRTVNGRFHPQGWRGFPFPMVGTIPGDVSFLMS